MVRCQLKAGYGQVAVERGFNINKDTQVENLRETSLVSLRLVYDEVLVSKWDIPPAVALSCKQAYSKYKEDLAKNKKEADKNTSHEKRELVQEEYANVKRKNMGEEKVISNLQVNIDSYISQAANQDDPVEMEMFVVKASSFKKSIEEMRELVLNLEKY